MLSPGDSDPLCGLRRQITDAGLRVAHDGHGRWHVKRADGTTIATRPTFSQIEGCVRQLLAEQYRQTRDGDAN